MTKAVVSIHEMVLLNIRETCRNTGSIIPETNIKGKFRDDGRCPECFAEMTHNEGITTCDLCGYTECD